MGLVVIMNGSLRQPSFRVLLRTFWLLCFLLGAPLLAVSIAEASNASYGEACGRYRGKPVSGSYSRRQVFKANVKRLSELQKALRKARTQKKRRSLRRQIVSMKRAIPLLDAVCRSRDLAERCTPRLTVSSLDVLSGGSSAMDLGQSLSVGASCTESLHWQFLIATPAVRGSSSLDGSVLTYQAPASPGVDSVWIRVCSREEGICGEAAEIPVSIAIGSSCTPRLPDQEASVRENSSAIIPLQAESDCAGVSLTYQVSNPPQRGTLTARRDGTAEYESDFGAGEYQARVRACIADTSLCSTSANLNLLVVAEDFSGAADSLASYRDRISQREAAYLLKKVAFGGCQELLNIGTNQGLTAMVDALLNDPYGGCRYNLPYAGNATNTDPDRFGYYSYHPAHGGYSVSHWRMDLLHRISLTNVRYHSPLKEFMTWVVWHNHFATDAWSDNNIAPKHHYNILARNSLGFFGDFFRDFYGRMTLPPPPAQYPAPGVDPDLTWHPDYQDPDELHSPGEHPPIFNLNGAGAPFGDVAYHRFLGNHQNTVDAPNENLGRELLELHTMGSVDPITGSSNYTQDDVRASTLAITGYAFRSGVTSRDVVDPRSSNGISSRLWFGFFSEGSLLGPRGSAITLFAGMPFARSGIFTSNFEPNSGGQQYLPYLLSSHPGVARNIGAKLFTQLVHPLIQEEIVRTLAAELLRETEVAPGVFKPYDLKPVLRILLRSQAMFSDAALGAGVQTPLETFGQAIRFADVPMTNWWEPVVMLQALTESQQQLMAPPTVFGWRSFGVARQNLVYRGEDWLNVSPLLGTVRGMFKIVNATFRSAWGAPDVMAYLPRGTQTTAGDLVDAMATRFRFTTTDINGVAVSKLTPEERQILIEYVQEGVEAPGVWDPTNWWVVRRKVAGLTILFGTHPESFLKG